LDLDSFRAGELSEKTVNVLVANFLNNRAIASWSQPPSTGWLLLDETPGASSPHELAEWVTAGELTLMLGGKLARGSVVAVPGAVASEEVTRAIVSQTGAFVALISGSGQFLGLCDRGIIVDKLARGAVEHLTSA
jgi:hypothetical protein